VCGRVTRRTSLKRSVGERRLSTPMLRRCLCRAFNMSCQTARAFCVAATLPFSFLMAEPHDKGRRSLPIETEDVRSSASSFSSSPEPFDALVDSHADSHTDSPASESSFSAPAGARGNVVTISLRLYLPDACLLRDQLPEHAVDVWPGFMVATLGTVLIYSHDPSTRDTFRSTDHQLNEHDHARGCATLQRALEQASAMVHLESSDASLPRATIHLVYNTKRGVLAAVRVNHLPIVQALHHCLNNLGRGFSWSPVQPNRHHVALRRNYPSHSASVSASATDAATYRTLLKDVELRFAAVEAHYHHGEELEFSEGGLTATKRACLACVSL